MAQYSFTCERYDGYSHTEAMTSRVKGTVELADEDVATLVKLMRENGTSDVDELGLEETEPRMYNILYEACSDACFASAQIDALLECYYDGVFDCDKGAFIEFCFSLGFKLKRDMEEYQDSDGNFLWYKMTDFEDFEFRHWLEKYVKSMSLYEAEKFFKDYVNGELEEYETDYDISIVIPQAIIDMAFPPTDE
jgi:hypothetical protein